MLDECLARLAAATLHAGGLLAITADHGNAEEKLDAHGNPMTAHTTNPVPFILIAKDLHGTFASGGKLGDVAPTLLDHEAADSCANDGKILHGVLIKEALIWTQL